MDIQVHERNISNISDEVNDLHRLLRNLLPKIEDIEHVEQAHGTFEKGADFLLKKRNRSPIPGHIYVGVVAKIGKMHQNTSAVEEQIKQCFLLDRFSENGKDKISISEAWVITTDNITNGAKEIINKSHANRIIHFIDGKTLAQMLFKYIPNYWRDLSPEIMDLLSNIIKETEEKDKKLELLHGFDEHFYIEPRIIEIKSEKYQTTKRYARKYANQEINILKTIDENPFVIIQGNMGSGKSKMIRNLVGIYASPDVFCERKMMPISITFKDLKDQYGCDLDKVIENTLTKHVKEHLPEGLKFVIFLDAIDEVNLTNKEVFDCLNNISSKVKSRGDVHILATVRDLARVGENKGDIRRIALPCYIAPLSLTQVMDIVKKACKKVSTHDRLFEDLKKSQLFKNIPKSPITAILLANIINQNSNDLPSNLTELYSKYMEIIIGRWDIEKGLSSSREYEAAHKILMQISEFMLDNQLPEISIDEAKRFIGEYLAKRNIQVDSNTLFEKIKERCEIIAIDIDKNTFAFKHKSFAEFLYAEQMRYIQKQVIDNDKALTPYWLGMMFFYIGLKKDCPDDLQKILDLSPRNPVERVIKIFNMADYFLAGYASPIDVITKGITMTMLDAAKFYFDIVDGRIKTNLSHLSKMNLVAFLRFFMGEFYSYSFLQKPLEDASYEIVKADTDEEEKIYALFFISIALIQLGVPGFDVILKEYAKTMPLEIKLAIEHECNDMESRKKLLKTQNIAIKKILHKNKITPNQLRNVYKTPILEYKKD